MKKAAVLWSTRTVWIISLVLVFSASSFAAEGCEDLSNRPCCRLSQPVNFTDNVVHPLSHGSCVFSNTLCSYTQGCVDNAMSSWTTTGNYAFAEQTGPSLTTDGSVLVSPLLNLRIVSCIGIRHFVTYPTYVDLFIEYNDTPKTVIHLYSSSRWSTVIDHWTTVQYQSTSARGRVMIRARGGGNAYFYYMQLVSGQCKGQACQFDSGLCAGWTADGWTIARASTEGQVARIIATLTTNFTGVLTTDYTRAPGPKGDCLTFDFYLRNDAQLHVSIELTDGVRRKVWKFAGKTWGWKYGRVPIKVSKAYRILFTGLPKLHHDNATGAVALDNVEVKSSSFCDFLPAGSDTVTTFPAEPSTRPTTSQGPGTSFDRNEDDSGGPNAYIIVGAVAAALVIAAVVAAVVITRRRRAVTRNTKYPKREMATITGPNNDPRHSDVNPYEEAQDGAPGTIRTSIGDGDNVDQRKLTKTTTLTVREEGREGDYSQVDRDGACSLANPLVSGVCGLPRASNISSAKPKLAGKHSSVIESSPRAAVVPQPRQEEGDYNMITYDRKKAVSPGKGRETIDNPYNVPMSASETGDATPANHRRDTIQRVEHLGDGVKAASKSEGSETTEGEHQNDAGVYFILEPDQTTESERGEAETDEYNTLSFTASHGATAMAGSGEGKHNVYNHVCTDMDGDYSTAQIGKRNVVIDSKYESINY